MSYRIVLSGGPFSGKTELLRALDKEGFHTISEAARTVIKDEKSKGKYDENYEPILPQTQLIKFQKRIGDVQEKAEQQAKEYELTFQDRGFIDQYTYALDGGMTPSKKLIDRIKNANYTLVFMCDLLDHYNWDEARWESKEHQEKIHEDMKTYYKKFGIPIINVPTFCSNKQESVKQRVSFIIQTLKNKKIL